MTSRLLTNTIAKGSAAGITAACLLATLVPPAAGQPSEPVFTLQALKAGKLETVWEDDAPALQQHGSSADSLRSAETSDNTGSTDFVVLQDTASGTAAIADMSLTRDSDTQFDAMAVANNFSVSLSWTRIPNAAKFVVTRNGAVIGETTDVRYFDLDVTPGAVNEYRIETVLVEGAEAPDAWVNTVDSSETPVNFPPTDETQVVNADTIAPTPQDYDLSGGRSWGHTVQVPYASSSTDVVNEASNMAAAAAAITYTNVQHTAFIRQAYIDGPPRGCGAYNNSINPFVARTYKFGGDNRSFQVSSSRFRTRLTARVYWTTYSGILSYTRGVNASKVYRVDTGAFVATRQASAVGIRASKLAASTPKAVDIRMRMESGNAFCTGIPNTIAAVYTMTVTRTGSWSIISGSHKRMPAHEIYINRGSAWRPIYQTQEANPACLVNGACPNAFLGGRRGNY